LVAAAGVPVQVLQITMDALEAQGAGAEITVETVQGRLEPQAKATPAVMHRVLHHQIIQLVAAVELVLRVGIHQMLALVV
jgi:hypothetical protein